MPLETHLWRKTGEEGSIVNPCRSEQNLVCQKFGGDISPEGNFEHFQIIGFVF